MLLLFACRRTLELKVVSLLWIIPAGLFICIDTCTKITDLSAGSWSWSTAYTKMLSSPVWRCTKNSESCFWACTDVDSVQGEGRGGVRVGGWGATVSVDTAAIESYVFSVAKISPQAIPQVVYFSYRFISVHLHFFSSCCSCLAEFVLWYLVMMENILLVNPSCCCRYLYVQNILSVFLFLKICPRGGLCSHQCCRQMRAFCFSPTVWGVSRPLGLSWERCRARSRVTLHDLRSWDIMSSRRTRKTFPETKVYSFKLAENLLSYSVISVKRSAKRSSCSLFIFILKYGCIEGLSVPVRRGITHIHTCTHNKLYVSFSSTFLENKCAFVFMKRNLC